MVVGSAVWCAHYSDLLHGSESLNSISASICAVIHGYSFQVDHVFSGFLLVCMHLSFRKEEGLCRFNDVAHSVTVGTALSCVRNLARTDVAFCVGFLPSRMYIMELNRRSSSFEVDNIVVLHSLYWCEDWSLDIGGIVTRTAQIIKMEIVLHIPLKLVCTFLVSRFINHGWWMYQ